MDKRTPWHRVFGSLEWQRRKAILIEQIGPSVSTGVSVAERSWFRHLCAGNHNRVTFNRGLSPDKFPICPSESKPLQFVTMFAR